MKRKLLIIGLLINLFLVGCGGSVNTSSEPEVNVSEPEVNVSEPEDTFSEPDLKDAKLMLKDLPSEFQQPSDEELEAMGFTEEAIANSFKSNFEGSQTMNFMVFINPDPSNSAMVFSMIFYPLSDDNIQSWDEEVKDPDKSLESFKMGTGSDSSVPITQNPELEGIGDGSLGFYTKSQGSNNVEIVMARRKNTAFVIMNMFLGNNSVNIRDLAIKLDSRIDKAYK